MRRRTLLAAVLSSGVAPVARATGATPVVLELFTSQGCSSCPPADALLGRLARRPDVIALAWHVDYWNSLGWRDPYASRQATDRQRAYARQLGQGVFTPALVVGGQAIVVGSDRAAVDSAIGSANGLPVAVAFRRGSDGLAVEIAVAPEPVRALVVVYDPERTTDVGAGENDGAHLREYRIVREATVLGEWDGAARRFPLPAVAPGQGIAVLVQSANLRIVGAADQRPG